MKVTKAYEDYLETILILEKEGIKVQCVDIARKLNVSKAAVSKIVGELFDNGYITKLDTTTKTITSITLSNEGKEIAEKTYAKHLLIKNFLMNIGVSEENAEHDCCLIEHVVTDETIEKIEEFIKHEK